MKEKIVIKNEAGGVEEYWIGKKPKKENPLNKTYLRKSELDAYMLDGCEQ